ncbi:DUF411 domain-containing protein [Helicobacter mustelae]|nr:DUF411 domain-containing protein [Helicobacter mustelae]SQH72157.1 Protein of uncharacterised function, DUF [Helicobacter mustelae]STP13302.1 Protein of uncharacterised function, DUF [Helicobacter mustelae]
MKKICLGLMFGALFAQSHVTVYEDSNCGCCGKWSAYLGQNGFDVEESKTPRVQEYKDKYKIPREMRSCHTGMVEGYFLEGHIPAQDIKRLLQERPKDIAGLSVPNMPIGSPGMEQGDLHQHFVTYAIKKDGSIILWSKH